MKILKRGWNSPTITTWLSYSTKFFSLFGILPLVLKNFAPGDLVLWYLFSTIITLQGLADFGFRQTFTRMISYAYGGASDIGGTFINEADSNAIQGPNKPLLNSIVSTMKFIYIRLTIVLTILMIIFGTWSLVKPVVGSTNNTQSWWCWGIVLVGSCLSFYGKIYLNFLEGVFKIALVRRVEIFTSLGTILTSFLVLIFAPSLLNLVIATQSWLLLVIVRDWYLCITIDNGFYKTVSHRLPFNKELLIKIWQPAWKSGLSSFMSVGLTNLTGLVYAQVGATGMVASYLLALRIINQIKEVSMAPFYSNLPLLAILRVKNDLKELIRISKRGMFLSHLVYIIAFITVGLFSDRILALIHSEVGFVTQGMWILMGIAFFSNRFGAMHMQVYISTNHIIVHIADSIAGVLYIMSGVILSRYIGIYAIPIGMAVGYLGFYSWYAAGYSYRSLQTTFLKYEKSSSALPVFLALVYIVAEFCIHHGKLF